MKKPQLIPIKVPWKVSSTSFINLKADSHGCTEISFVADCVSSGYVVKVTFKNVIYAALRSAHSDSYSIDQSAFDWSMVPFSEETDPDISKSKTLEFWHREKYCPDPGFYEVFGADLSHTTKHPEYRMWLIPGKDVYAEIVARSIFEIEMSEISSFKLKEINEHVNPKIM